MARFVSCKIGETLKMEERKRLALGIISVFLIRSTFFSYERNWYG